MAKAGAVSKEVVRGKIEQGESLSPMEMLVCRVHAFGNGLAIGERKSVESVPIVVNRTIRTSQHPNVERETVGPIARDEPF